MNGRKACGLRREWSVASWAKRSGERVCKLSHRDLPVGERCPACKASV